MMALKIVHIGDQDKLRREAEVRAFWEEVLKPKWEAEARMRAEKLYAKFQPCDDPGAGRGEYA